MKHLSEHLRFPGAAVEALTEFRQITGQGLGWTPGGIGIRQGLDGLPPSSDIRTGI